MCADLGDWQAPESLTQRIGGFIDAHWPRWQFIAALFVVVAVAAAVTA